MMGHPSMTSRGRRIAGAVAIVAVLFLPKHVECGFPDATCRRPGPLHTMCTEYEVEPLGFYGLEIVFGRDIGFAYSSGLDCH